MVSYRILVATFDGQKRSKYNVGDYMQSNAGRQFLPAGSRWIGREHVGTYDEEPTRVIMNAWWNHWPGMETLSPKIDPLFISYHLHHPAAMPDTVYDYLREHAPIGCRDMETVEALEERGIKAYFTGCLTLTLGKTYQHVPGGNEIVMVDMKERLPLYYLRSILNESTKHEYYKYMIRKLFLNGDFGFSNQLDMDYYRQLKWRTVTHDVAYSSDPDDYFKMAEERLRIYERAALVITPRLHVAMPCLAMGTPVLLVLRKVDNRFGGILDLTSHVSGMGRSYQESILVDENGRITNPDKHVPIARKLTELVENWMNKA